MEAMSLRLGKTHEIGPTVSPLRSLWGSKCNRRLIRTAASPVRRPKTSRQRRCPLMMASMSSCMRCPSSIRVTGTSRAGVMARTVRLSCIPTEIFRPEVVTGQGQAGQFTAPIRARTVNAQGAGFQLPQRVKVGLGQNLVLRKLPAFPVSYMVFHKNSLDPMADSGHGDFAEKMQSATFK